MHVQSYHGSPVVYYDTTVRYDISVVFQHSPGGPGEFSISDNEGNSRFAV